MISNVLSEALENIGRYERDFADMYSEPKLKAKIESVKLLMLELQIELDALPSMPAPTIGGLSAVGVDLINWEDTARLRLRKEGACMHLRCKKCGATWEVISQYGKPLCERYWKCPVGNCN